jgi:O-antigen/teichoic acid export membrane protein
VPKLAYLHEVGEDQLFKKNYREATRKAFLLTLVGFVVFMLGGKPILAIFGESYSNYSWLLLILGVSHLLNSKLGLSIYILASTGYQNVVLKGYLLSFLASTVIMVLLVPKFSLAGAALGTLGGTIIMVSISSRFIFKKFGVGF